MFLEERLKGKTSKKPALQPRKTVFEEGKFREFLQLEKNKIEGMFAEMKRNVRIGAPEPTNEKPTNSGRLRPEPRFTTPASE